MSRPSAGTKSHRLLRVGELLRHAISELLMRGDIRDPALEGSSITVTEVRVSPDLRNGTVFVMPLGGSHTGEILEGLERCSGYIRGQMSKAVTLRYVPKLKFELDHTFDEAGRIDRLLKDPRVARDLVSEEDISETDPEN